MAQKVDNQCLGHSFEMMRIDFEQRSQEVIQLTTERSKSFRIALIIWTLPLLISSVLLKKEAFEVVEKMDFISFHNILAIGFISAGLINCIILSALISSRNSINFSTSGMNYLRSVYFDWLYHSKNIHLDDNLKNLLGVFDNQKPIFKYSSSKSSDIMLILTAVINIIYGLLGVILCIKNNLELLIINTILFIVLCTISALMLSEIKIGKLIWKKK